MVMIGAPFASNETLNNIPREKPGTFPRDEPGTFPRMSLGFLLGMSLGFLLGMSLGKEKTLLQGKTSEKKKRLSRVKARLGVIIAGPILMVSAPPRPGPYQCRMAGSGPEKPGQQVTYFRRSQGDQGQ